MRSGKWKSCLFVVVIFVFLTANCWASNNFVISMSNNGSAEGRYELAAVSFSQASGCGGKALKFYRPAGWNDIREDRIHVWTDDSTLRAFIRIAHEGVITDADFHVSTYSDGTAYVCVNNAVRIVTAAMLGNTEINNSLRPIDYSTTKLLAAIFASSNYSVAVLAGASLTNPITAIVGSLAVGTAVAGIIESKLPDADQYIKDHLYLWYSYEPQNTNPCASPDYSYVKYQVKPGLIDPFWDYICKNSQPNQSVERYRDWGTCRLIANSSIDGSVYVYGQLQFDTIQYRRRS